MSEYGMYYDRRGFPLDDVLEWASLFERDNRVVKQSRHKERGREFFLSTVWLGIDHSSGQGRPLIFETMAFEYKPAAWNDVVAEADMGGIYQDRYSTEDEALEGHDPWRASGGW